MKLIHKEKSHSSNQAKDSFFSISADDPNAIEKARQQIPLQSYLRKEIVTLLSEYNASIDNDHYAEIQIKKLLHDDSHCVVTGQQLGLMGGPFYTILKGISCLLLARKTNSIPIFWLATDDHDACEIDHTFILNGAGNIEEYKLVFPKDGTPVEDLYLNAKSVEEIYDFIQNFPCPFQFPEITSGKSYSTAMAKILVAIFAGTGMVFLEPKLFRSIAIPFFQKELKEAENIRGIIHATTQKYLDTDDNPLIYPIEATNLFMKDQGIRRRIYLNDNQYRVGKNEYSLEKLLQLTEQQPELFSSNVASRPILQSWLFPTLAYVAGPNEVKYFHQLKDYFTFHGVSMPWIVPRMSATIISKKGQYLLEKCKLQPWDNIPKYWYEIIPDLDYGIVDLVEEWEKVALVYFEKDLSEHTINRYVRQVANKIQKKVCKSRLKKQNVPYNALHYLRNLLHPHNKTQERVFNWLMFQSDSQENLIESFLKQAEWKNRGEYFCYI